MFCFPPTFTWLAKRRTWLFCILTFTPITIFKTPTLFCHVCIINDWSFTLKLLLKLFSVRFETDRWCQPTNFPCTACRFETATCKSFHSLELAACVFPFPVFWLVHPVILPSIDGHEVPPRKLSTAAGLIRQPRKKRRWQLAVWLWNRCPLICVGQSVNATINHGAADRNINSGVS